MWRSILETKSRESGEARARYSLPDVEIDSRDKVARKRRGPRELQECVECGSRENLVSLDLGDIESFPDDWAFEVNLPWDEDDVSCAIMNGRDVRLCISCQEALLLKGIEENKRKAIQQAEESSGCLLFFVLAFVLWCIC